MFLQRAHSKGQTRDDYKKAIWYLEYALKIENEDTVPAPLRYDRLKRLSPSLAATAHNLDEDRSMALREVARGNAEGALEAMRAAYRGFVMDNIGF